jgi:hypothetical protein
MSFLCFAFFGFICWQFYTSMRFRMSGYKQRQIFFSCFSEGTNSLKNNYLLLTAKTFLFGITNRNELLGTCWKRVKHFIFILTFLNFVFILNLENYSDYFPCYHNLSIAQFHQDKKNHWLNKFWNCENFQIIQFNHTYLKTFET